MQEGFKDLNKESKTESNREKEAEKGRCEGEGLSRVKDKRKGQKTEHTKVLNNIVHPNLLSLLAKYWNGTDGPSLS